MQNTVHAGLDQRGDAFGMVARVDARADDEALSIVDVLAVGLLVRSRGPCGTRGNAGVADRR